MRRSWSIVYRVFIYFKMKSRSIGRLFRMRSRYVGLELLYMRYILYENTFVRVYIGCGLELFHLGYILNMDIYTQVGHGLVLSV